MMIWPAVAGIVDAWARVYSNAPVLRTTVEFAHIGGLVVSAGWAITTDRAILGAARHDAVGQKQRLAQLHTSHRYVVAGLGLVVLSGLLLLAADADTYLTSRVFWSKMAAIGLLSANGVWLRRAGRLAETDPTVWPGLRRSAVFSLLLWSVTTFLGAALPNVS